MFYPFDFRHSRTIQLLVVVMCATVVLAGPRGRYRGFYNQESSSPNTWNYGTIFNNGNAGGYLSGLSGNRQEVFYYKNSMAMRDILRDIT